MKRGRRSTEEIIRILRSREGLNVEDACREHGISPATYHRYKRQYGGVGCEGGTAATGLGEGVHERSEKA